MQLLLRGAVPKSYGLVWFRFRGLGIRFRVKGLGFTDDMVLLEGSGIMQKKDMSVRIREKT